MHHTRAPRGGLSLLLPHRIAPALAIGLAIGSVVPGCASATGRDRNGTDRSAIIGGVPHDGDPAVLYLTTDGTFSCTASLIAPRVVMTALHCVEEESGGSIEASRLAVGTGSNADGADIYANVRRVETPPGSGLENRDIAILVLDRAGSLTPYEIARVAPSAGDMMVGIGYGQTDGSARGLPAGRKYRGQNRIGVVDAREISIAGALSCYGDSGGPGFVGDTIAGVVSRGTADTCEASEAIYTRVDAFASWIDGIVAAVESEPEGSDPGGSDPGGSDPGGSDPGGSGPGGSDPGGSDPGGDPSDPSEDPSDPGSEDPWADPSDPGGDDPGAWDEDCGCYPDEDPGADPGSDPGADPGADPSGGPADSDGDWCPDEVDMFPDVYEDFPFTHWGEPCLL